MAAYKSVDSALVPLNPPHDCCTYCTALCKCEGTSCSACVLPSESKASKPPEKPKGPTRNVTAKDRLDLQSALEEVFQEIKFQSLAIDESVSHGFSPQLISEVVNNGENIFTTEDVLTNFPVFSVRNAIIILEVIQDLFLDIPSLEDTLTLFDLGSTFDHVTWLTLEDMIFSDSDDDCQ